MAKGIVLDNLSAPGSVGQTNPMPVRVKDGTTGIDVKFTVDRTIADAGKVAEGSIAFTAAEDLTTEKKTSAIALTETKLHPDGIYLLVIDKPAEDTAGNLTVNTYNLVKVDGTNEREVLLTSHTIEKITGLPTYRAFLIQGLFIGEGVIKLGASFTSDSGAITVYFKLFRL